MFCRRLKLNNNSNCFIVRTEKYYSGDGRRGQYIYSGRCLYTFPVAKHIYIYIYIQAAATIITPLLESGRCLLTGLKQHTCIYIYIYICIYIYIYIFIYLFICSEDDSSAHRYYNICFARCELCCDRLVRVMNDARRQHSQDLNFSRIAVSIQ